jgi:hypothetical protein
MDTKYFREALGELGYKQGKNLTTERLREVLHRAQELKEIAARRATAEYFVVSDRVLETPGAKSSPEASTVQQIAAEPA